MKRWKPKTLGEHVAYLNGLEAAVRVAEAERRINDSATGYVYTADRATGSDDVVRALRERLKRERKFGLDDGRPSRAQRKRGRR